MTLAWIAALFVYPLLASDPKGPAWAFCLGVELAVGLALVVEMAVRA